MSEEMSLTSSDKVVRNTDLLELIFYFLEPENIKSVRLVSR